MLPGFLYTCPHQNIAQTRARETSGANRPSLPLNTRNVRLLESAAIPCALQRIGNIMAFKFTQLSKTQCERPFDFAADTQTPLHRIQCTGFVHVVADEEMGHRCKPGVEVLRRHFEIEETERTQDHSVLPWN